MHEPLSPLSSCGQNLSLVWVHAIRTHGQTGQLRTTGSLLVMSRITASGAAFTGCSDTLTNPFDPQWSVQAL